MHACMYIHTCIYACMYVHTHMHEHITSIHAHVYIYTHTHVYMRMYTCARVYTACMHACTYMHTRTSFLEPRKRMYAYTIVHTAYMYVYIHTHTWIHTCISFYTGVLCACMHVHTHTQNLQKFESKSTQSRIMIIYTWHIYIHTCSHENTDMPSVRVCKVGCVTFVL